MTISSTTVRNSYSGDGTTDTFTYNFKIFQDSDIQVIIRSANGTETIKTITTHYTVTDAGVSAGGTVVFTAGNIPTATETVVLRRNIPQTQAIDYIANDPFPAESHEEGLDRATMAIQQIQEEVTRSLKLSKTNTMTSTEFTVGAADRANKILAFDASGEISVTQELGTYKGTDTTITTEAYVQRDIVKSTSATQLNNVYICVGDSVVGDLLTDTDHFDLLVDAVSAAASATAAASSATDAETAQTAAETAQTAAETAQTAELAETNAETAETNAETAETNAAASEANAATSETNAAASEAAAATSETNAATSETNAATSESNASTSASTATTQAGIATTQAGIATTQAGNASTSASNASTSESNAATSESNAATSASNAATSESNAAASAAAAATAADNFDDTYLGAKASDPAVDNDGDPLNAGDLYFNTTSSVLKYYDGAAWNNVEATDTSNFATKGFSVAMSIAL
jgi:chemotaxis protein histidine kinase CheA